MHTLYLNYRYDRNLNTTADLLERYHSSKHWCEAVHSYGGRISYAQRFHLSENHVINDVEYYFVNDGLPPRLQWYQNPKAFHTEIALLKPDIIHYNGQIFHLNYLRPFLPKDTVVLWQHHGGEPPTFPQRIFYKRAFGLLDGFMFSSLPQADAWKKAGLILPHQSVYEILEASTRFTPLPYGEPRTQLGLQGEEIFLWVGRLNANKDPFTILKGFADSVQYFENPHLYMIYTEKNLLKDVRHAINSLSLSERVHLIGSLSHHALRECYSAADYFVLGSHHEGSGYALLEAIACGVMPVVPDIPPFRRITGNGAIGYLWNAGNAQSFAKALQRAQLKPMERSAIVSYFQEHFSYERLGNEACLMYGKALENRKNGRHSPSVGNFISSEKGIPDNRKRRLAFMMPGGVAQYDKGLHIPTLFQTIERLSQNFDITVYSFVVLGNESGTTSCGNATVKFVTVDHASHWLAKTWKIFSAFTVDHLRCRYDTVIGMLGLPSETAALMAAKFFGIPSAIYLLGGETAYIPTLPYGNMGPNLVGSLTKWVCRTATALLVLTNFQAQQLKKFGVNRSDVKVIPAGVDTGFFNSHEKRLPQKPYRFLHVANLNPVKDQSTLLKAFALINAKHPSLLRIAGADHMNGEIHKLTAELGIRESVEFLGYLSQQRLREEYCWADALLHTSLYEAEGVVIAEAAAAGLLICGTDVGLLSDLGKESAVSVEPGAYRALASNVLNALESPQLYSKLVANSKRWALKLDLSSTVKELTVFFSSL